MDELEKTKQQRRRSQIRTGFVMILILGAIWLLSEYVELTGFWGLMVFAIGFFTVIIGISLIVSESDYYQPIKKKKMEEEAALKKRKEQIKEAAKQYLNQNLKSDTPDAVTDVHDIITEENQQWPLFEEKELRTMGWDFLFCKDQWDEVNKLLKTGKYDEAEKKTYEFKEKYMDSLIEFDLLLLEAQHRKGDFKACSETYENTKRPSLAFFSPQNKTPLVLEYCEAMLDLQGTIPMWIQAAWKGAHDCLNEVMRSNPPERSYVICIRAFKAALDIGEPLFGGNEEALIKDYIKSGLSWYPESKALLKLKSEFE